MHVTDPHPPASPAARDSARLAGWIRLEQTPGVGPDTASRLLERYTTPANIFQAGHQALRQLVPEAVARALSGPLPAATALYIDSVLAWLAEPDTAQPAQSGPAQPGAADALLPPRHLLCLDDPAYPLSLRQLAAPPVLLYAVGRTELLARPALAIVGSRNATVQGVANATAFGAALSAAGLTIVSGLALGIDAAAHEGGLRGPGATVAVIGTGADRIYPHRNAALARRIAAGGCILSEYPLGMGPLPNNFPRRNRIISGLCAGVLVVEAAAHSGSLITAHIAVRQGREVFAMPGPIHAPLAKGCHTLIRAGAKLVDCAADVLEELRGLPGWWQQPLAPGGQGAAALTEYRGDHLTVLHALGDGPVSADALAALTDIAPGFLLAQLLSLELAGQVERLPGGLYQRVRQ